MVHMTHMSIIVTGVVKHDFSDSLDMLLLTMFVNIVGMRVYCVYNSWTNWLVCCFIYVCHGQPVSMEML